MAILCLGTLQESTENLSKQPPASHRPIRVAGRTGVFGLLWTYLIRLFERRFHTPNFQRIFLGAILWTFFSAIDP